MRFTYLWLLTMLALFSCGLLKKHPSPEAPSPPPPKISDLPAPLGKDSLVAYITADSSVKQLKAEAQLWEQKFRNMEARYMDLERAGRKEKQYRDSLIAARAALKKVFQMEHCLAQRVRHLDHTFDCYVVDVKKADLRFFWLKKNGDVLGNFKELQSFTNRRGELLAFATNGGMYTPLQAPQGLYIENFNENVPIDTLKKENLNFYMQPNGVFGIDSLNSPIIVTTQQYLANPRHLKYATQSGPMVVVDGEINAKFKQGSSNLNIRSGVGIVKDNQAVFVISNEPVNFYDFARLFKEYFKCRWALYLDGAISEMYLPEIGRFEDGKNYGPMIGIFKN